jgi:DNA-binding transcriptional ArsR family regulator
MEKRRDVFQAIADPTRRDILALLSRQTLNLNGIVEHFDSSRPTISEHIKLLTECGLILVKKQGRERFCQAKLDKLSEVSGWVDECRKHWNLTLDSMEEYLQDLQSKQKPYGKSKKQSPRGRGK